MAVTFFWRCEGTTLDSPTNDYTAGTDTAVSTTGSPAINATAALVGSNGIQINAADEYYRLDSEAAILSRSAGAIGFYIRIQSFGNTASIMQLRFNSANSADRVILLLSTATNNHIKFRISESGGFDSYDLEGPEMSVDTTYFVICRWDNSANDRSVAVYDSGGAHITGSPVEDLTTSWTNPSEAYPITNGMTFGELSSVATSYYLDNIFIGTAWADGDTIYTNRNQTSNGRASKNTRPAPLGVEVGMGWRM